MRWWKVAGLAGVAGVAATGVVVARDQRKRRSYTPEEIRERLHARFEEQDASQWDASTGPAVGTASGADQVQEVVPADVPRRRWRPRWPWQRHKR